MRWMRFRSALPALLCTIGISHEAGAVAPAGEKAATPVREHVFVSNAVPTIRQRAWDDFVATAGGGWNATWDAATGVPSRVFGGSVHVPGSSSDPAIAEAAARAFLSLHLDLLAPGVGVADLVLVSNHDDGRIRSLGFVQRHHGLAVVGGQISVRFQADRLYVVSSQILPDVQVDVPIGPALDAGLLAKRALAPALANAPVRAAAELVIVPLVSDDAVLGYRVARALDVDGGRDGSFRVWADPTTGEPLLRRATRSYASGTLVYSVPVRWPGGGYADYAAQAAQISVNGTSTTTGMDGSVVWSPDTAASLNTSVHGDRVDVWNTGDEDTAEVTRALSISPAGTARWSDTDDVDEAQLVGFIHTQIAKDYGKTFFTDADMITWLDSEIRVTTNIADTCNAYYGVDSDGVEGIHFFIASQECENTGRLADVVYHEFGHGVHANAVIEGVGMFPNDNQEGVADFYAALITDDHEMGLGFFHNAEPLRDLDPLDEEAVWPDDAGEVHTTGLITGGAFWDLWTLARAQLGEVEGLDFVQRMFVAVMERSTDTPSILIEALAADDDNGNLGDGTPHECLIREAFGHHGLRTVTAAISAPDVVAGTTPDTTAEVVLTLAGMSAACPGDEVDSVDLTWIPRYDSDTPAPGNQVMAAQPGDAFLTAMPLPDPGDVAEYHATVHFSDGTTMPFPDNRGDPTYQLYRGDVIELYCSDFESDPFADGWTTEGANPELWQWGAPTGQGGDPAEAYDGTGVLGLSLSSNNGTYPPDVLMRLLTPQIDVGAYSDVRLQYRRWLGVEDGFYDHARIYVNGEQAWQNFDSGGDDGVHTRDKEWVFRDLPMSSRITDGTAQLAFELESDGGLELGGWTLDSLCIVADPNSICGDDTISGAEQCDDGALNENVPDACRINCRVPTCGDGILDSTEGCDDGNREPDDECSTNCVVPSHNAGCCSTGTDPRGALLLVGLAGFGLFFRRRRR
jgi:MYXO-CTERM domain-containing protein